VPGGANAFHLAVIAPEGKQAPARSARIPQPASDVGRGLVIPGRDEVASPESIFADVAKHFSAVPSDKFVAMDSGLGLWPSLNDGKSRSRDAFSHPSFANQNARVGA